ncbi:hypothetical protein LOY97_006570 [Ophidiomyces ophidiicola]|nr:hypothetical protein LOZ49_006738 [Ophidiomyces ophidiicola]KAI2250841.1 hypothetical protein LOZ10_006618 [Ophidiomyces ophidiicola]KAI2385297.1 hypothetical protein LOY90_006299 [Ophidiomyces ophidiicola]KAI2451533.1 hypothetical protein LOY97_006570 [Ophidiomyces ophidiicola]
MRADDGSAGAARTDDLQDERHVVAGEDGDGGVNPPQHPGDGGDPRPPARQQHEDGAVDDGGEAHGKGAEQHGVGGVAQHGLELVGPDGVAQHGDDEEEREEGDVEHEDGQGDVAQAGELVGQAVEQDGGDAGAHGGGEPSGESV